MSIDLSELERRAAVLKRRFSRDYARLPDATRDIDVLAEMVDEASFLIDWTGTVGDREHIKLRDSLRPLQASMIEKLDAVRGAFESNERPVWQRLTRSSAELLVARTRRALGGLSPSDPDPITAQMLSERFELLTQHTERGKIEEVANWSAAKELIDNALANNTFAETGVRLSSRVRAQTWTRALVLGRDPRVVRPGAVTWLEQLFAAGVQRGGWANEELQDRLNAQHAAVLNSREGVTVEMLRGNLLGGVEILRGHWRQSRKKVSDGGALNVLRSATYADRAVELEWQLFDMAWALDDVEGWTALRHCQDIAIRLARSYRRVWRAVIPPDATQTKAT